MEEQELKEYQGRFFKNREILSSRFVKSFNDVRRIRDI